MGVLRRVQGIKMDGLGSAEEQAEAKAFVTQAFADRCWQTAPVRTQRDCSVDCTVRCSAPRSFSS